MDEKTNRTSRPATPNGCRAHGDCLSCPLPVCIEEMTPAEARRTVREHETEMMDLRVRAMTGRGITRGEAVRRLAGQLGVKNTCNIYRKLKRHRLAKEARREG